MYRLSGKVESAERVVKVISPFISPFKQLILTFLSGLKGIQINICTSLFVCLFVLRFYGPVNPMGSCRARSVYLTTRLLGRL